MPRFAPPEVGERRYVPNEVLLTTSGRLPAGRLESVERRLGLSPISISRIKSLGIDVRRYRLSDTASVRGVISALRSNGDIKAVQPNFVFQVQDDVQDGARPLTAPVQYAIDTMKLGAAHKAATGAEVLVAVIDTGLDETNPEIADRIADRFDALGGSYRALAHGTGMAGVIVAHRDLVGIAPDARILAIRAFDTMSSGTGQGTSLDIVRGLDFAVDHGARIINMSFAGPRDDLLEEALAAARKRGVIEIAAAGNAGPGAPPLYPAAEPGVIAITASDTHNRLFPMASRGPYVTAAAPGVDILVPSVDGGVQLTSGTSVAAAEASGVVALLLQSHPRASAEEVRKILHATADAPREAGDDQFGVIDADAALQAMSTRTSR